MGQLSLNGTISLNSDGYYRSKLFITHVSSNPIVAAAGPIFSILERVYISTTLPPLTQLHENIHHELRAFLSRMQINAYIEDIYVGAYYLLCATVDELLGRAYLRIGGDEITFNAFTPPSPCNEPGPDQRFFLIIDHIKDKPNQYLDLIELAYYCLTTGFEGKYHNHDAGRMLLDNLIEELFQLIKTYRAHKTYRLFKNIATVHLQRKNYQPLIKLGVIAVGILIVGMVVNYSFLINKVDVLQLQHKIFEDKIIN